MNVSTYKNGSVLDIEILNLDERYEINIDTERNVINSIRSNNYNYPNGVEFSKIHQEVYIEGLNITLKTGDKYDKYEGAVCYGAKEKIENGLKEFFSKDNSIDIKDKILCSLIFKEILDNSILIHSIEEEKGLKDILTSLYYHETNVFEEFIEKQYITGDLVSPKGIKQLIESTSLKDDNLFENVLNEFNIGDIRSNLNYVAIKELGLLDEHLNKWMTNIDTELCDINNEDLFIIENEKEKVNKSSLISDGEVIIYKNTNGNIETIPMDGEYFDFKNQEYPASIEGLRLIEMDFYGSDYKITGDLDDFDFEEPEPEVKKRNKLKP